MLANPTKCDAHMNQLCEGQEEYTATEELIFSQYRRVREIIFKGYKKFDFAMGIQMILMLDANKRNVQIQSGVVRGCWMDI